MATQNPTQEVAAQTPVTTIAERPDVNKLITNKEQILSCYPDVFEGIGKFPGPPYSIQLDPSIPPHKKFCSCRREGQVWWLETAHMLGPYQSK